MITNRISLARDAQSMLFSTLFIIFNLFIVPAIYAQQIELVQDINTTRPHSEIGARANFGNLVLFVMKDELHGLELWRSDGTAAGTYLIQDLNPGPADALSASLMMPILVYNGYAYFPANDGTLEGTFPLYDLAPGSPEEPDYLTSSGGKVYFRSETIDGDGTDALWIADGFSGSVTKIADATNINIVRLLANKDGLYFTDAPSEIGEELFLLNDLCVDSGFKFEPGVCGCLVPDTDSDNDGVADCIAPCPNDSLKISSVGACGCGISDQDDDQDGVPNCLDLCPSDSLKIASLTCGCGVSEVDLNINGVTDCLVLADFKATIAILRKEVKLLRKAKNKKQQRTIKIRVQRIKQLVASLESVGPSSELQSATNSGSDLGRVTSTTVKRINRSLRTKAKLFPKNKRAALKGLKKLDKSLA